jgi:hypothetical protein
MRMAAVIQGFCFLAFISPVHSQNGGGGASHLASRSLTPGEKKLVQTGLARNLKDPDSMQIRWTAFRPTTDPNGMAQYCATYNAKNSFGAYGGFRPFLGGIFLKNGKIIGAAMVPSPSPNPQAQDYAATKVCRDSGLDPFAELK